MATCQNSIAQGIPSKFVPKNTPITDGIATILVKAVKNLIALFMSWETMSRCVSMRSLMTSSDLSAVSSAPRALSYATTNNRFSSSVRVMYVFSFVSSSIVVLKCFRSLRKRFAFFLMRKAFW
ncbi:MAG: hypothetical protein QG670_2001 [Thermoproteota archaeon]|nr:hypothetical protein [Thermoproteota archaeon]